MDLLLDPDPDHDLPWTSAQQQPLLQHTTATQHSGARQEAGGKGVPYQDAHSQRQRHSHGHSRMSTARPSASVASESVGVGGGGGGSGAHHSWAIASSARVPSRTMARLPQRETAGTDRYPATHPDTEGASVEQHPEHLARLGSPDITPYQPPEPTKRSRAAAGSQPQPVGGRGRETAAAVNIFEDISRQASCYDLGSGRPCGARCACSSMSEHRCQGWQS
jgi:hypothetical protein